MNRYRVIADYGICDTMVFIVRAKNEKNALKNVTKSLKKLGLWQRVGLHNMTINEDVND
jgi:hypothetical protein